MCGIAGSINCILTEADVELLKHRGPDSHGIIQLQLAQNKVYLGHTRLSILDVSEAGNQPMFTDCGNYAIVFNGEIYNHTSLRNKLPNIKFNGHSDTETILYYIREFGIESVKDFNGIFAFAFVDKVKEKLFLVRDFFGVKPLYYYLKGNKLLFGSEIKIIKNNSAYKKEIDVDSLNSFLTFRYNPSPQTLFKDIKKLQASSCLQFNIDGSTLLFNYCPKTQKINNSVCEVEAITEYKRLLQQAVKKQLLSDVPVGLLLSGGLDSAVLGYLMSKECTNPIDTFSIGFEGKGIFNELDDAKETASIIKSNHHQIYIGKEEYMKYFYKSFYHTEEPIAEPIIPALYFVSDLASKYVKVVLSGQGADEPMAGYKRYLGEKFLNDYRKILSWIPLSTISSVFSANGSLERLAYSAKFKNELDRFIAIYTLFTPALKRKILKDDFVSLSNESQKQLFEVNYRHTDPLADSLSRLLFLDTRSMLCDDILLFNDKITMANSIENRVPYLDIDLMNFIESLPIRLKLKGKTGKYIHRKAAEEWLPQSIIDRKKRAFETPVGDWFKNELSNTLIQLVDSSDSFSRNYFKIDFIKEMIMSHKAGKRDFKKHLFILLSLELWYKNFYQ